MERVQLNPHYNPSKKNNGGEYNQPAYVIKSDNRYFLVIDENCGNFGTRYTVSEFNTGLEAIAALKYYINEEKERPCDIGYAHFGTMIENEYTKEFSKEDMELIRSFFNVL